jgi:predicted XRE-type DNA-binding protein
MPREPSTVRRTASTRRAGRRGERSTPVADASVTSVGPHDNVFAALDLPDADEWLVKAELAREIQRLIGSMGLTQIRAAAALGGAQSDISNLARGRLAGYSMERLYRFLNALGQDVRIVVRPKPRTRPEATVRALVRKTA